MVDLPRLKPMLATSGPLPADLSQAWVEPKIDGFRGVAFLNGREPLRVESRSGRNLASALPELADLPGALGVDAILDGELVTLDADGRPDFYALGPRLNCARPPSLERARRLVPVSYVAFDVLWLEGKRLTALPYRERRAILESLVLRGPAWATVPSWVGEAEDLFRVCEAMALEGVVVKRDHPYREGRSRSWLKLKTTAWKREHAPRRRPGASVRSSSR